MTDDQNQHSNGNAQEQSPIKFPCDFTIKVMGKSDAQFEKNVLVIIKQHFPAFSTEDTSKINKRYSKDNNYLSLSVTVFAENKAQLDATYQALSECSDVLMSL